MENIILIGHSLGAHVCAFAAKRVTKLGYGKIPLLLAADPANPLFPCDSKCEDRLCESDAKRVIVFHTSTLGMSCRVGHLDLQFNNGNVQPGCGKRSIVSNYYVQIDVECC